MIRLFHRLVRGLAADDGEVLITTAGLLFIASVTASTYGLLTNGGGAYVDTQKLGYTDDVYSERESNLRTQRDYFDQRAQQAKDSGNAKEAEKWSKASAQAGMELTYTYDVHDDTTNRIANERTGKVIRAGISVTPAKALEGWALAAKLGNAMVTVGAVQSEQDRRARVEAGLEAPNDEEKEALLREGRRKAAIAALNRTVPGRDKKLIGGLGDYVTSDLESEVSLVNDPNEYGDSPEGLWLAEVGKYVDEIDPAQSTSAGKNALVMESDVKSALKSGKDDDALVLYNGPNGLEPAIVKRESDGSFSATFPLMKDSDPVKFTEDLKYKAPPKRSNSRSCPYLYAFDGSRFVSVNDIFSVSRDPKREYDDQLLFSARGRSGVLPLRIKEVRDEESFIDSIKLTAIDCEQGFTAAVTPEGRLLSVAGQRAPERVYGARQAEVAAVDGAGAPLRDSSSIVAQWAMPSRAEAAVLLLSSDGFEDDGVAGQALGQRPTMTVEVWDGREWRSAGAVYPKEETDTMAVDLSQWAGQAELVVRITGASCHTLKYQSIDRIALSTARSDAVRSWQLPLASATFRGGDVLGSLATSDDVRVHTTPGDVVYLRAEDVGADAYLLTSRGWYRPVGR